MSIFSTIKSLENLILKRLKMESQRNAMRCNGITCQKSVYARQNRLLITIVKETIIEKVNVKRKSSLFAAVVTKGLFVWTFSNSKPIVVPAINTKHEEGKKRKAACYQCTWFLWYCWVSFCRCFFPLSFWLREHMLDKKFDSFHVQKEIHFLWIRTLTIQLSAGKQ